MDLRKEREREEKKGKERKRKEKQKHKENREKKRVLKKKKEKWLHFGSYKQKQNPPKRVFILLTLVHMCTCAHTRKWTHFQGTRLLPALILPLWNVLFPWQSSGMIWLQFITVWGLQKERPNGEEDKPLLLQGDAQVVPCVCDSARCSGAGTMAAGTMTRQRQTCK